MNERRTQTTSPKVVGRVTGREYEGDQCAGMPRAICHACGLGYRCSNPDCEQTGENLYRTFTRALRDSVTIVDPPSALDAYHAACRIQGRDSERGMDAVGILDNVMAELAKLAGVK